MGCKDLCRLLLRRADVILDLLLVATEVREVGVLGPSGTGGTGVDGLSRPKKRHVWIAVPLSGAGAGLGGKKEKMRGGLAFV